MNTGDFMELMQVDGLEYYVSYSQNISGTSMRYNGLSIVNPTIQSFPINNQPST